MSHSVLQVGGEVRRFGKLALLSLPGNARIPDGRWWWQQGLQVDWVRAAWAWGWTYLKAKRDCAVWQQGCRILKPKQQKHLCPRSSQSQFVFSLSRDENDRYLQSEGARWGKSKYDSGPLRHEWANSLNDLVLGVIPCLRIALQKADRRPAREKVRIPHLQFLFSFSIIHWRKGEAWGMSLRCAWPWTRLGPQAMGIHSVSRGPSGASEALPPLIFLLKRMLCPV